MSARVRLARRAAGLLAVICLAGCAALQGNGSAADDTTATAGAAGGEPARTEGVAYRVDVQAPTALRNMLLAYLDLARFQNTPQVDGITNAELIRLAAASPAQARTLLETEGYFQPQITVTRTDPPNEPALITLTVEPGPQVVVAGWTLLTEGELAERAKTGDADALALSERLQAHWPLKAGMPFSQSAWDGAKSSTMTLLRADGYPAAAWGRTEARVDARTHEARLTAPINSGPRFLLGELRIEGLSRYDEKAIRNVVDFGLGTPYTEKRLFDFQERIARLGLFSGVSVEIDPDPTQAAAVPVRVKVQEQLYQQAVAGIGFSANTRERLTFEHHHRRPFGYNVQAHNKFELGRNLRSWESELLSNPQSGQYRNLAAGGITRLATAGDVTLSWKVRAGRTLYTERIERLIFGEYIHASVTSPAPLGKSTSEAVTANYNWIWRDIDDPILPTRGLTSVIQLAGGFAQSNPAADGPFARLYTRHTLYWPLGGQWFSQARVEFGEVFSKEGVGIPEPLLFRAGGDDSVRGYGYREIGPRVRGVLTSGNKLLTASAEIARPFSSKQPAIWWAAFVDAGDATNNWKDYSPSLGYGLGVRWRSPVGPLRIDWAYGREVHKGRLHFSVGIVF